MLGSEILSFTFFFSERVMGSKVRPHTGDSACEPLTSTEVFVFSQPVLGVAASLFHQLGTARAHLPLKNQPRILAPVHSSIARVLVPHAAESQLPLNISK